MSHRSAIPFLKNCFSTYHYMTLIFCQNYSLVLAVVLILRSRELLQSLTNADLSNEAFPFRTSREIDIGYVKLRCNRITYLGELGKI